MHSNLYCFISSKCSVCPPCCWTTHCGRRWHSLMARSMKHCKSLPIPWWSHAGASRLKWVVAGGAPSVEWQPNSVIDWFVPELFEAQWTWRTHFVVMPRCSWQYVMARRPATWSTCSIGIFYECGVADHHRAHADSNTVYLGSMTKRFLPFRDTQTWTMTSVSILHCVTSVSRKEMPIAFDTNHIFV